MSEQPDVTYEFVDAVPEAGNPVKGTDLTCEVCGTPLIYAGSGRKPKFCDEHKRATGSKTARRSSNAAVVDRAVSELTLLYGLAGGALKFVEPITGDAIYNNREKLGDSWRLLLETDARFRKLFADVESKAAWLPIIAVHGDLIASIMLSRSLSKKLEREHSPESEPEPEQTGWPASV